jgi:hypothetical protein
VNFADVQQRLDQLLRHNRGNIDATLSELQALVSLLARNSTNLENTLCTLPAGLFPYADTTSWGEWFNVRITRFILRDPHGKTIFSSGEQRGAHPVAHPYTHCAGSTLASSQKAPAGHGGNGKGTSGNGGGRRGRKAPPGNAGFGNVGDLIKSILAGQHHRGAQSA